MESYQDFTFFHKDPGWDPKGQPKQQKGKCLAGRKTLTFFLLDSKRSIQDLTFSHQDPGWDPKGQPKGRKGKCLTSRKTQATFY
jgi:hypothetical protein